MKIKTLKKFMKINRCINAAALGVLIGEIICMFALPPVIPIIIIIDVSILTICLINNVIIDIKINKELKT